MSPDLETLRDIHDSLGNPWWPPAPGWWLIGLLLVAAVVLFRRYGVMRLLLPPIPLIRIGDWRWDARRELRRLRRRRPRDTTKMQFAALAELLKRIAMARHGRSACAGLHGQAWLKWLNAQDPEGFDWCHEAEILIRAPYAPDPTHGLGESIDAAEAGTQAQLERLIKATERWILIRPSKAYLGNASAGRSQTGSTGQSRQRSTQGSPGTDGPARSSR